MSIQTDPYTSRGNWPQITERQDPVVYGDSQEQGLLSLEKLRFYNDNGYLFLPDFFSPQETQTMQEHQQRLWNESQSANGPEYVREAQSDMIRSIFAVHHNDPFFAKLLHDPRLMSMARQILGSDSYIHQSRINFKAGLHGKDFYWHSDFETWHAEDGMARMRAFSISIALTENTAFNGPLMVMPGSHRYFIACVGATPKNHYQESLRQQQYGTPDDDSLAFLARQCGIEMPTGSPGSVLVFDCNIMHGSNSNISPYPRSNVFAVYNSVENRLVQPFAAHEPRPSYIATR
jgi:ectoine hydroxylase